MGSSCLYEHYMGAIKLFHPTSRRAASTWIPKLSSSAPDAHRSPLETWYLKHIRIASRAGIYPLTCKIVDGESVSCVGAIKAAIAGAVAAAECTTALSVAPSLRPPTLITTAPSKDPKTSSHHHLHMPPHSLCERNHAIAPPPHYLPVIGEQLAPEAAP